MSINDGSKLDEEAHPGTGCSRSKAAVCAACHGTDGIGKMPIYPNLKGQNEAYLAKQMKAFRDGIRKDPTMNAMAKPLSDTDIDNLSAYYSSL